MAAVANEDGILNVLELYCGIGGIHFALDDVDVRYKIVAAVDINTNSNAIYSHNFPTDNIIQRNILSLSSKELDRLNIDLITMSPPCQPFTRLGKKKDCDDPRTSSLVHVLQVLRGLRTSPSGILLENVKGFEDSDARHLLVETMERCDYRYQEFLLNPLDLGIPNSRLRYYLIASKRSDRFCFDSNDLRTSFEDLGTCDSCSSFVEGRRAKGEGRTLSGYLVNGSDDLSVADKILSRYAGVLDIVKSDSIGSCCFTKGYGTYAEGTGSVLQCATDVDAKEVFEKYADADRTDNEKLELLRPLKLRYFNPREIANLMCFPSDFEFPSQTTTKQRYKALGNSVNVSIVSILLRLLTCRQKR